MKSWTCKQCGRGFEREGAGERIYLFCSQKCYHAWREANNITIGQFKPGLVPWNKNLKGIHLSPSTQFHKGIVPDNKVPVGTVTVRTRQRDGKQRAWVKVAEPNTWRLRAVIVWEQEHGPLPRKMVVHHKDRNTLNDDPGNLEAKTRGGHMNEHRPEFEGKRRERLLSRK